MSKFDMEVFFGGYDSIAVSKEKYTKDEAIEIAKRELEGNGQYKEKFPYIAIGNAYARHRAGMNEDNEPCVGWWLEYVDHGRNCPVWCFHRAKSTEEIFKDYEYILDK